jgi:hypothetical protein
MFWKPCSKIFRPIRFSKRKEMISFHNRSRNRICLNQKSTSKNRSRRQRNQNPLWISTLNFTRKNKIFSIKCTRTKKKGKEQLFVCAESENANKELVFEIETTNLEPAHEDLAIEKIHG